MKILVTGGAGFIGSHLVDRLVQEGHRVVIYDNLSLGRMENIQDSLQTGKCDFLKGDLLNKEDLFRVFDREEFDVVFHLAANSDIAKSHVNPDVDFGNTLTSTYNVLLGMKKYEVKQIVFASTSAIYGDTKISVSEDYGPLFPISHYGDRKSVV